MTDEPEHGLDSVVAQIRETNWTVEDYDVTIAKDGHPTATVELEYTGVPLPESGAQDRQRVRVELDDMERERSGAVPIDELRQRFVDDGMDPDRFDDVLSTLRRKGDIYEPTSGHVRVV